MAVWAFAPLLMCTCLFAEKQSSLPSRAAVVLASMPKATRIDEVSLSPDGSQVAYIVKGEIAVVPAGGGSSRTISVASKLELRDLAWSADGQRLAFIADLPGDVPAAQVWIASMDSGDPVKHAELKGYVQSPRFSPDGTKLALLFIEGMPRVAGPL